MQNGLGQKRDSGGLCLEVGNELGGMKLGDMRIQGWYRHVLPVPSLECGEVDIAE